MTHPRSPHYRALRFERNEDRRLLSATTASTPEAPAEETFTYLPIASTGWLKLDSDSQLPAIDFSTSGVTNVVTRGDAQFTLSGSLVLGGLNATTESFRGDPTSVRLSADSAADRAGLTVVWGGIHQSQVATPLLSGDAAGDFVNLDPALTEAILATLPDRELTTADQRSAFADALQRLLNKSEAFVGNGRPNTDGWIGDEFDTYHGDGDGVTDTDLGSWSQTDSNTGPATPTLEGSLTRGDEGDANGSPYNFNQEADGLGGGSRLLSKLREWFRDEAAQAATESLDSQTVRSRTAATPLERVTATPAPAAGVEAPGAGMIDLAALLLPAGAEEAPSVALAASSRPADTGDMVSARDAALAVESWVRTLPVPAEPDGVFETIAPPVRESAVGVRDEAPVKPELPRTQSVKDRGSAAIETPRDGGHQTPLRGSERHVERLEEGEATSRSPYVAAWLTTLLGGAVVWANRRGGRRGAADCIETPRRDLSRGGHSEA